jgi:Ca-activated chloride channel homolog
MRHRLYLILVFLGFLGLSAFAQAQHYRTNDTISADTKLVRIQVIVFDEKGEIAGDLNREDFHIFDDGVEQPIQYFANARQPVSLVLSLDDSWSMTNKIPFVREAAYSLLAPFPDAEGQKNFRDEFSLIRFASRAELVASFGRGDDLQPRIDGLIQPTKASTPLFDSVYLAVATEQDALNERRAIILVTDGGDNHSRYSLQETKHFLEEADVPVFAVMAGPSIHFPFFSAPQTTTNSKGPISPNIGTLGRHEEGDHARDFIGPDERRGPRNMKELTDTAGGAVFTANRLEDLQRIVQTLGVAVRYSYLIGYDPPAPNNVVHPKGRNGWHKVSVQLVPQEKYRGYMMYTKRGYYETGSSLASH